MITRTQAQDLVQAMISDAIPLGDDAPVVIEESTIEKPWGWIFFYQSQRYVETGDLSSALIGNAPIIVNARTGLASHTGSTYPVEHYIEEYERENGLM